MKHIRTLITALLLAPLAALHAADVPPPAKPNIIIVMPDDLGYGDYSCLGSPVMKTPEVDAFWKQSIRFTNFHVSPTCSPTRSALLSGRHEFKNGVTHTIFERERVSLKTTTLAQALKSAGYTTGIFGKWHLGDEAAYQPDRRGFDEVYIHGGGGIGQTYPGSCGDAPGNLYQNPTLLHNGTFEKTRGYCTDLFFGQAIKWMDGKRKGDAPFFAYIPLNVAHVPLQCPEEDYRRYAGKVPDQVAKFYGMIQTADRNFGRLLAKLKEWDIEENTLVILIGTDNGGYAPACQVFNAGMRGHKGTPYQGGTRAPCFWRWPAKFQGGRDVPALTAHMDVFPTLAAIAEVPLDGDLAKQVEGRSLLPLLQSDKAQWPDRILVTHVGRWARGKSAEAKFDNYSIRDSRFTLVNNQELYDLQNDYGESRNIISDHPAEVAKLRAAYEQWWNDVQPLLVNETAIGPKVNPFKERYWQQFGGSPTLEDLQRMDPLRTNIGEAPHRGDARSVEKKQTGPTWYPRFSWEVVPVYKMFGAPQLLTDEQARTIATTSDFICIEKAHGLQELGGAELGAKHEMARLKQLNPQNRALFYFNAARAWPFTTYSQGLRYGQIRDEFKPFIVKEAKTGELAHKERIYCFDVLNPGFRKWWTETVAKAVSETGADGVFVDQMHGNAWLHPGKQAEVAEAQAQMMRMTKQAIGAKKILLLNNGAHIPALFEIGDAFMFEHCNPDLISKENIVRDWELMKKIADAGKISVWRIGVEIGQPTSTTEATRGVRNKTLAAISQTQLDFYLAAFLIGVQEYSYFQYGWGWSVDTGPLVEYPALRKSLGPPKGAAHQDAEWIFRREFEHAKIRVDLDKRQGTIEWNAT